MVIGKTFEEREIVAYALTSKISFKRKELNASETGFNNYPGILITGLHHARELISVTSNVAVLLKYVYLNEKGRFNEMEELFGSVLWYFFN